MRVQLVIAAAGLVAACNECETPEQALQPCSDCSIGAIRRGRFVGDHELGVASSPAGTVVRADCAGGLRVLGSDLAPQRTLAIDYRYSDLQRVEAIAVDGDGAIAAITYEHEYIDDIDERSETRLLLFDLSGALRWAIAISSDDLSSSWKQVVLGPDQVFIAGSHGRLRAFDRATGAEAWTRGANTVRPAWIAARAGGGAAAIDMAIPGELVGFAADGRVEWSVAAAVLGVVELDAVAVAPDGAIAVLGNDGALTTDSAQRLVMLAPDRSVRWMQPFDRRFATRVSSLATDGERIVVAGEFTGTLGIAPSLPASSDADAFVATVGAAGIETVGTAGGPGVQQAHVASLATDAAIYDVTSWDSRGAAELALGHQTLPGDGVAIVELAR